MKLIRACSFAAALLVSTLSYAASITVPNFSFEDPDVVDGSATSFNTSIPGWTKYIGTGGLEVRDPLNAQYPGATGVNASLPGTADAAQSLFVGAGEGTTITSNNVVNLEANTRYLLTVAVGNPLDTEPANVRLALAMDNSILAFTTILATSIPKGTFTDFSVALDPFSPFDGKVGSPLDIQITVSPANGLGRLGDFDNVRLTTTVPEPAGGFVLTLCAAFEPPPSTTSALPFPPPLLNCLHHG